MKKLLPGFFVLVVMAGIFQSCEETIIEDQVNDVPDLKSAANANKSYIVLVNDAELDLELNNQKNYENKKQAVRNASEKILKRAGITDGQVEHVYGTAVKGFSVKIPPGQLKKLQDDPSVTFVEEDQEISLVLPAGKPDKSKKPGGGGDSPEPAAQEIPWGITMVNGSTNYSGTSTAWIIDSGIDLDHNDLNVDVQRSRTFLGTKTTPDDQNGHGTHVAGTVAAINNNIGVVGVAPGAKVVSVRVLDRRGSGRTSGVISGVDYVAANASSGDVANMSLGGGISSTLDAAVLNASSKCRFTIAAGNSGADAGSYSPARVNGVNIYTISAMDSNKKFAGFSNWGNPPIDYCAPGVSIKSTWKDGGYNTISGTSMAAPHVAGILLLGNISTSVYIVSGDPDGNPDPIAIH